MATTVERPLHDHPSVEEVEASALDALFARGIQLRLYVAPFIFMAGLSLLALDPSPWRRAVVGTAFVVVALRVGYEYLQVRKFGFQRSRLKYLLPVPATMLIVVISSSGGIDSPLLVMAPLVTVFLCLFLKPQYGFVMACLSALAVWALALVSYWNLVPDMVPLGFGGGPRASADNAFLLTRAIFLTIALFWGFAIGWVMRRAYQSAIERALHARDDILRLHEDSTRTLTTLAAEIAHELKNPLTSVKGLAALVDRDVAGKEKERLAVLRREVDRMQDILESFLNFSRPLVPLDLASVHLGAVTQQVVALHEGLGRERGVDFRLDVHPTLSVKADERKLKQVLINLVQNALDAAPPSSAVDIVVGKDGERGAKISVMDRGPGITDSERVFEPGVTSKPTGHGLGLTVARLISRQHGGDVRLLPREGGGTVAEITLPEVPPS